MRAATKELVDMGASESFKTSFTAAGVTEDAINGTYKQRSYVVSGRLRKKVLMESMANQDDNFSLTRLPCGEDKEDLRQQIKDAKANLEVKQAVKMELDKALANPPGVTWNDVYDAVKTKVNASRPSGAPQAVYGGETRLAGC